MEERLAHTTLLLFLLSSCAFLASSDTITSKCEDEEVNCILVEDTEKNLAFRSAGPTLIGITQIVSREECESRCLNNKECQALILDGGYCILYRSVETGGGTYDLAMIKTCTSDPFICPEGHEEFPPDSKQCRPCLRGFYRSNDTDQRFENCSMCQSGKTTVGNGSISDTECDIPICPAGERVLMPQKTCERCPVGTYQPEEAQFNCSACNENYTTENDGTHNASQCLFICLVGHEEFPPDSKQCRPCLRGFYRSNDTDQRFKNCSMCPDDFTTEGIGSISEADCDIPICSIGTYLNITTKKCVPCALNTYQDEMLKQKCKPCPSGYKTEQEMSTKITDCKFVCPAGQQAVGTRCLLCPRGTYKDESMMFDMCQNCTGGNTTDSEGAVSVALCNVARCTKGFKVSDDNSTCMPCPYDTYQDVDLPYSTTQCQPCPHGSGTENENSISATDCKVVCEPGFGITNGTCLPCENGTWNDGQLPHRFMKCQPCPENFTTPANMAKSKDNCTLPDCKPGSYIDGMTCTPCEKGFYQPNSLKDSCIPCEQNKFTSNVGSVSSTECSAYCPAGQEELGTTGQCFPCQNDHYKPVPDFGSCSACTGDVTSTPNNRTACTEQFCDLGREPRNGVCENCKVGYYKSERGNTGCSQCPANRITPSEGSKSKDRCTVIYCDPGLYLDNSMTCTACPMGSYKNDSGNQSCTECPVGVTTPGKGSTRSEDCYVVSCAVGQFRHNSTLCLPCPIGQYQNETDQDACKQCANVNGYETTTISASSTKETDCLPLCSAGKFLQISDRSCQNCPVGTYKSTTNLDTVCQPCPSNYTTSTVGSTTVADCRYPICLKGHYRPPGKLNCELCPYGTYQNSDNNPNVAACTSCPAGNTTLIKGATDGNHYCVDQCGNGLEYNLGLKACQKCPVGQYTPAKSEAMEPNKCPYCPQGSTTTASGQSGISSCVATSTTPAPPVKFSVTVSVRVTVDSCENPEGVIATLMTILRQLLSIQRAFYQGLCPRADCSTNVNIDIRNLCANQKRRKRAAVNDTEVLVTVSDIDSILQDNSTDMIRRPSLPVIEEAFYNQRDEDIQKLMGQWAITLIEFGTTAPQISCQDDGYYYNPASSACDIICGKGYYRPLLKISCELCPLGTYQNSDNNVAACTSCPAGKTTLIKGATDGNHYCVDQCDSGSEYNLGMKACQKCPVGQYTPAKSEATEPSKCRYCPQGSTTTASGQSGISSCVATFTTPAPPVKITVTVGIKVTVDSCENPGGVKATLMTILRQLLSIQREIYQGLCPRADCSTNVNIDIQNLCANQKRRKRAAVNDTEVLVTVSDIDSILQDNSTDMIRRPSLPVIEEAFYNQRDAYIQKLMGQWAITLIEFWATAQQISCQDDGYYYSPASSACETPSDNTSDSTTFIAIGAGAGIGGCLVVVLIIVGIICYLRRSASQPHRSPDTAENPSISRKDSPGPRLGNKNHDVENRQQETPVDDWPRQDGTEQDDGQRLTNDVPRPSDRIYEEIDLKNGDEPDPYLSPVKQVQRPNYKEPKDYVFLKQSQSAKKKPCIDIDRKKPKKKTVPLPTPKPAHPNVKGDYQQKIYEGDNQQQVYVNSKQTTHRQAFEDIDENNGQSIYVQVDGIDSNKQPDYENVKEGFQQADYANA